MQLADQHKRAHVRRTGLAQAGGLTPPRRGLAAGARSTHARATPRLRLADTRPGRSRDEQARVTASQPEPSRMGCCRSRKAVRSTVATSPQVSPVAANAACPVGVVRAGRRPCTLRRPGCQAHQRTGARSSRRCPRRSPRRPRTRLAERLRGHECTSRKTGHRGMESGPVSEDGPSPGIHNRLDGRTVSTGAPGSPGAGRSSTTWRPRPRPPPHAPPSGKWMRDR